MRLGGSGIAVIAVLAVLGFGGGYAIASAGGDEPAKPKAKTQDAALPAVAAGGSSAPVKLLGAAPALPRSQARKPKSRRQTQPTGPSSTPTPEGPSSTPAPSATAPPTGPTEPPPPARTPKPPVIIEG